MTKDQILSEIRRTAKANGGVPLGWKRFETETGIGYYDWFGKFGGGWNDLVREAGFEGNRFVTDGYSDDELVQALIALTRSLKRVPVRADVLFARRQDKNFPSETVLRRLGGKSQIALRIVRCCRTKPGHDDVLALWEPWTVAEESQPAEGDTSTPTKGYVYLLKHGARSEYKIGRTYSPLRREGEIGIEMPEKVAPIHYIETDDPAGVENYWHTRFAAKRKQGEWFALSPEDVRAFKRWKRIF
jgi:Meiotically up-regulated gene 113